MIKSLRQRASAYRDRKKQFFRGEKHGLPLYGCYFFSGREKLVYGICSMGITGFLAFFFYRSPLAVIWLWPIGLGLYFSFQKDKCRKRRQKLEAEFKDCMVSVSANLRAGYSVEHAFWECAEDMQSLYGEDGLMLRELYRIKKGLGNNVPLEQLLCALGERSGSSQIKEFGEVFAIARNSGGSLPEVMQSTADLIGERIAAKQEIQTMISGKVFEQKIMSIVPFLLTGYIEAGNKGFFDSLYHNTFGCAVMTGCLVVYLGACYLANRICRVAV